MFFGIIITSAGSEHGQLSSSVYMCFWCHPVCLLVINMVTKAVCVFLCHPVPSVQLSLQLSAYVPETAGLVRHSLKMFVFGQWTKAQCESPFNCALEILLLIYLLTYLCVLALLTW